MSSLSHNNLFRVYNIAGSLVGVFAAADGGRADLSGLAAWIYFIRARDGGAVVKYVKR
ncbi:MAG: T9SS type A sorting domain-containing protein [Bacteroidales bacterium]|nr:T9SS type A sorting domain-containing protein [Bacteroidales bacterium]